MHLTTKSNEMPNKTSASVPGGCPESGLSNNVTSVCWIPCNANESFRRTIQHTAFRLALISINNDLTGLGWLPQYVIGHGDTDVLGWDLWLGAQLPEMSAIEIFTQLAF
jgi:hypothetical protein